MLTKSVKRWGHGNRVDITDQKRNYLDGLLLGDGYYGTPSIYSSFFRLNQKAIHEDWVSEISQTLQDFGIKCLQRDLAAQIRTTKTGVIIRASASVYIQTSSYRDLLFERNRWYQNKRKILPKDIDITDTRLLAQWYMGDGSFSIHQKNKSINVRLHTNSFSEAEVQKLSRDFCDRLELRTTINHWRRQPILCIQNESASRFL